MKIGRFLFHLIALRMRSMKVGCRRKWRHLADRTLGISLCFECSLLLKLSRQVHIPTMHVEPKERGRW